MPTASKKNDFYPPSIVCLSYDVFEILYAIGGAEKIVGKPSGAVKPGMEKVKSVGGFKKTNIDVIKALKPDLVIGYSEICADVIAELTRANLPCMVLQHTCLDELYRSITLLGGVTGYVTGAARLINDMQNQFKKISSTIPKNQRRPVVYFEEWNDPPVCGVQWVSELIDIAGGIDGFAYLSHPKRYLERAVKTSDIAAIAPDIILASWCGKRLDKNAFGKRAGWASLPAVTSGHIYEVPGRMILQPGPALVEGARYISDIINQYAK